MRTSSNEAHSVPVIHSVQSIGITAHQTRGSQPGPLPNEVPRENTRMKAHQPPWKPSVYPTSYFLLPSFY